MPIYPYKCSACGHAEDVLQKMSDTALSVCPACGKSSYAKQLTAPGFALKGSGWYATDFKGGPTAKPAADVAAGAKDNAAGAPAKAEAKGETKTKADTAATVSAPVKTAAPSTGS